MIQINVPCGKGFMKAGIPEKNFIGSFSASVPAAVAADEILAVQNALDHPFDSAPLEELAAGADNAVIIASDHTRPVPAKILTTELLHRLRAGNKDLDITILIATGCHRSTTEKELISMFGEKIVAEEKIYIHDCDDEAMLCDMGELPSGSSLRINKLAAETDLLISEGFIEPHFFAGFSGGRKAILPGISSRRTVMENHCAEFINSPYARTGILENNPIHCDMAAAAGLAGLVFSLNVVLDSQKKIVAAYAGSPAAVLAEGAAFLDGHCRTDIPEADIVITSNGGYPLDQNVYQCVKSMSAGEVVCRDGGVIITVASCADGHGGEGFYQTLKQSSSPGELLRKISATPRKDTLPDQWQYQILARIMERFSVIIVSDTADQEMIRDMKFLAASTVDEALEMAFQITGREAGVAVIPDGVSVITHKRRDGII